MKVQTRFFGEIELVEDKIITFNSGLMGFEQYKEYTIIYDVEEEKEATICWLQSIEEPTLALPVINSYYVMEDYNPTVEDELLKPLGEVNPDNLLILLVLKVPQDVTKMTANLKAPLIINSDTRKGSQIIVENPEYEVNYKVYESMAESGSEKGGK